MSSDELAIVRALCDAVVAGDLRRMSEIVDPDVVFFGTRGGLDENHILRGPEALVDYMVRRGKIVEARGGLIGCLSNPRVRRLLHALRREAGQSRS